MQLAEYRDLRRAVAEHGFAEEIEWANAVPLPPTSEALWREYAWVVINSGMRNQVAQGIWDRVRPQVEGGGSAADVFGHAAKAAAIDDGWKYRALRFESFLHRHQRRPAEDVVHWCEELPWIGPITKWHLAKNLGIDCAKPDRWLERVATEANETVRGLCRRLAKESGDRVAAVDLVIWRACNLGLWQPS